MPAARAGLFGQLQLGWIFLHRIHHRPERADGGIFMAQLHPTGGLTLDKEVNVLAYQALND
jgi:hypothetical protein